MTVTPFGAKGARACRCTNAKCKTYFVLPKAPPSEEKKLVETHEQKKDGANAAAATDQTKPARKPRIFRDGFLDDF